MQTFTDARPFVQDDSFEIERHKALPQLREELKKGSIDPPIIGLLEEFIKIPHCFTLQSCYGHFVHDKESDFHNVEQLSNFPDKTKEVNYRIAYMALCIRNDDAGKQLFQDIQDLTKIDLTYIQFGSANWFWERQVNSYTIQIEPERSKNTDSVRISFDEAIYIENLKNEVFTALFGIALKHQILTGHSNSPSVKNSL
ncbi:hypothetical protein V7O62_06775 [Methanolobus sp. ZRKC2]|uniref:hypothetical protein n=1 Tax=Methanolobus sp. ZRKC2 TaxID=3125783 RepID=UPI003256872A